MNDTTRNDHPDPRNHPQSNGNGQGNGHGNGYGNGNGNGHPYGGQFLPVAANGQQAMAVYNPYTQPEWSEEEIDLKRLWQIILKYRWLIITCVAVCVVTAAIASMMMRPVYRASALIEVKPNQRVVKFENLQQASGKDREYLNTQMNILQSNSIAQAVVEEMNLAADPEFNGELTQRGLIAGIGAVKQGIFGAFAAVADGLSPSEDAQTQRNADGLTAEERARQRYVGRYQSRLTVGEVRNSDLLRVNFDSFSPRRAAELANAHTRAFIEISDERRFNSTSGAKEFLQRQIEEAQADLESSEKSLTDFARDHNIVDVEDRSNVMETRLEDLNKALTTTRQARINAQVEYKQAQEGNIDAVPAVLEGELIRSLRAQYATLRSEYEEMSRVFKDSYPKLQQLKTRMNDIKATLDEQSHQVVAGLENRYKQLHAQEQELMEQVDEQRTRLLDLKDRAISYNILKREWEANKELYTGLLEKQKDVSVAAGMEVNNISVVDPAQVPTGAYSPKTQRNVAIAGAFGLMGGIGIAFLLAFLDNTFRSREELEQALGLPFLGIVPKADDLMAKAATPLALMAEYEPTSAIAEASRSIRTSVLFSRPEHIPKKILVTSTTSGEGKSTIAANLALVLAQNGSRVLLMETDLRRPSLARSMNISASPGLTEYLKGEVSEVLKATPFDNVYCIPAGGQHHNPTDLLGSLRMDDYLRTLSDHFDFIIMDAPPILGLADSMILSSKSDGTLLVVKAASTEKEAVQETVKRLRTINAPLIGTVLNYVDLTQREYGYYKSYYYGYGDHKRAKTEHQPGAADTV